MTRFFLWTAVGLAMGLATHLLAILAIPLVATRTAVQRLEALGPEGAFHRVPIEGPGALPRPDPALRVAACRYDLSQGPMKVHAEPVGGFFSMSFYTAAGLSYYALTDRAANQNGLDLTLVTAAQLADLRLSEGPDTPDALRVEARAPRGVIVLRALAATPNRLPAVEAALAAATCSHTGASAP